ncbi:hypothetical protein [Virgibacillus chiguensis]|uniref:Uncharacterized protein n=1 Tax=Virgibacillus chiguensis TaxID=411959 RepID=A0A1M5VYA2_9BACI|nr:hypothetical protein [Virgibacillus chiguensis]SHH80150.1 hypothetical protein SAMN05421807_11436 [Virgibacillus chiguensis]
MNEQDILNKILLLKDELDYYRQEFWELTSSFDTWQFWFNWISVLIPLILLYIFIDRKRVFELGFFGFAIHVMWTNIDTVLSMKNVLITPHNIFYLFPASLTITTVVLPIGFMFIYQYCKNKGRNYYIAAIIMSAFFGYVLAPTFEAIGMLELRAGMRFTYIFLIDITVAYLAYWLTKGFWLLKRHGGKSSKQAG